MTTNNFKTPKSIAQAVQQAMLNNAATPVCTLTIAIATAVKDYSAQRFQVAMIRAQLDGTQAEVERLEKLFKSIYGEPGEPAKASGLPMWVIYNSPRDYPGKTVARLFNPKVTTQVIQGSLRELRERFQSLGFVNIGRQPQDDAVILEVWV